MIEVDKSTETVRFVVRVIPRSSISTIIGEHDGALKIKLKSPPVDGAANDELIRFLSKLLDVPRSSIEIVSGAASRSKSIRIKACDTARIEAILRAKI